MLLRPLAPFNVRPLKQLTIRKALGSGLAGTLPEVRSASIKAWRRPIRAVKAKPTPGLRVLRREH